VLAHASSLLQITCAPSSLLAAPCRAALPRGAATSPVDAEALRARAAMLARFQCFQRGFRERLAAAAAANTNNNAAVAAADASYEATVSPALGATTPLPDSPAACHVPPLALASATIAAADTTPLAPPPPQPPGGAPISPSIAEPVPTSPAPPSLSARSIALSPRGPPRPPPPPPPLFAASRASRVFPPHEADTVRGARVSAGDMGAGSAASDVPYPPSLPPPLLLGGGCDTSRSGASLPAAPANSSSSDNTVASSSAAAAAAPAGAFVTRDGGGAAAVDGAVSHVLPTPAPLPQPPARPVASLGIRIYRAEARGRFHSPPPPPPPPPPIPLPRPARPPTAGTLAKLTVIGTVPAGTDRGTMLYRAAVVASAQQQAAVAAVAGSGSGQDAVSTTLLPPPFSFAPTGASLDEFEVPQIIECPAEDDRAEGVSPRGGTLAGWPRLSPTGGTPGGQPMPRPPPLPISHQQAGYSGVATSLLSPGRSAGTATRGILLSRSLADVPTTSAAATSGCGMEHPCDSTPSSPRSPRPLVVQHSATLPTSPAPAPSWGGVGSPRSPRSRLPFAVAGFSFTPAPTVARNTSPVQQHVQAAIAPPETDEMASTVLSPRSLAHPPRPSP